jgi:hypothetical protein
MKYLATSCVALLALILFCQMQILDRLEKMAKHPTVVSVPAAPNVPALATELRKQMAIEAERAGPATFSVQRMGAGQAFNGSGESKDPSSGRLQHATLNILRKGGPAAELAVQAPTGMTSQLRKIQSTEDLDRYEVVFKPESGNYLPGTWSFSLTYTSADQKRQERGFAVAYHPGKNWPDCLDVQEKRE